MSFDDVSVLRPAAISRGINARPIATSVQMAVRDHLRREILVGALTGGTRLQQADVAKDYGVSITPVREALRDLAAEGLVDISPFSGATVHDPTLKELEDIYRVRAELAPLTVQDAIRNIDLAELDHAAEIVRAMATASEPDVWTEENREFHHLLDGATRNEQLTRVMRHLADLSTIYVAVSIGRDAVRRGRANEDHEEILDAYRRRDVDRAVEVTLRHMTETQELVRLAFRAQAPQDARTNHVSERS